MTLGDLIGKDLSDEEKEMVRQALVRAGDWIKFEVGPAFSAGALDRVVLPTTLPESADEALARLALIGASLDEKKSIQDERLEQRIRLMKAAQKIALAVIERGLPAILASI